MPTKCSTGAHVALSHWVTESFMSQCAMTICKSSNRDQFNWPWKLRALLRSLCWCAAGNGSGSTTNHLGSSLFKHSGNDLPCTLSDLFGWAGWICTASGHTTRLKAAFLRSALPASVNTVITIEPTWFYTTALGGSLVALLDPKNTFDISVLIKYSVRKGWCHIIGWPEKVIFDCGNRTKVLNNGPLICFFTKLSTTSSSANAQSSLRDSPDVRHGWKLDLKKLINGPWVVGSFAYTAWFSRLASFLSGWVNNNEGCFFTGPSITEDSGLLSYWNILWISTYHFMFLAVGHCSVNTKRTTAKSSLIDDCNVCIATKTMYDLLASIWSVLVGRHAIVCVCLLSDHLFCLCEKAFPKQAYYFVFEEEMKIQPRVSGLKFCNTRRVWAEFRSWFKSRAELLCQGWANMPEVNI